MIERVTRAASNDITLAELKGYLNVNTTIRDEELQGHLNYAIMIVEDVSNLSLTEQTIRIIADDVQVQKLYFLPVNEVTSVVYEETGADAAYTLNHSKTKIQLNSLSDVIIEYTTLPNVEKVYDLKSLVYQVASLLYDGETEQNVIEGVMRKIPRNIC